MPVHLDSASGLPLHPAARETFLAALDEGWADPGRLYRSSRRARQLLDNAREVMAAALGARPDEVTFTSSGTQAVHQGVLAVGPGVPRARAEPGTDVGRGGHAVEHDAPDQQRRADGQAGRLRDQGERAGSKVSA